MPPGNIFISAFSSGGSRGGGGVQGVPLLGHNVGFLTLGPKVVPPPFVNVQEWGCFSIFLRSDDVTRAMSKGGGVLVKNPVSAPGPPPFKNPGSAPDSVWTIPTFYANSPKYLILLLARSLFHWEI